MSQPKRDQLIRLVPRSGLAHEIAVFVIDRQARGLSPRTVEFYADELRYLRGFLERQKVSRVDQITPTSVRSYLLHLGKGRNPGGVHAAYRAIRAFLRWFEAEYEPQGWTNPIDKVAGPRVPRKQLYPASLPELKAMLTKPK